MVTSSGRPAGRTSVSSTPTDPNAVAERGSESGWPSLLRDLGGDGRTQGGTQLPDRFDPACDLVRLVGVALTDTGLERIESALLVPRQPDALLVARALQGTDEGTVPRRPPAAAPGATRSPSRRLRPRGARAPRGRRSHPPSAVVAPIAPSGSAGSEWLAFDRFLELCLPIIEPPALVGSSPGAGNSGGSMRRYADARFGTAVCWDVRATWRPSCHAFAYRPSDADSSGARSA